MKVDLCQTKAQENILHALAFQPSQLQVLHDRVDILVALS